MPCHNPLFDPPREKFKFEESLPEDPTLKMAMCADMLVSESEKSKAKMAAEEKERNRSAEKMKEIQEMFKRRKMENELIVFEALTQKWECKQNKRL